MSPMSISRIPPCACCKATRWRLEKPANGRARHRSDATIAGHVDGDVLVVLGEAQLASTAVIDGSFVVVGGAGRIAEGAQVHGDVFALGGLDAAPGFSPGGSHRRSARRRSARG